MSFMQRQIRKGLQSTGGQLSNLALRMEMTRAAVNLQCPGMQAGRFHEMERSSALNFVDFVGHQIVNLLFSV